MVVLGPFDTFVQSRRQKKEAQAFFFNWLLDACFRLKLALGRGASRVLAMHTKQTKLDPR